MLGQEEITPTGVGLRVKFIVESTSWIGSQGEVIENLTAEFTEMLTAVVWTLEA
jgi:hypothetical protein